MELLKSNFLSGATGYTILSKDNKKILLFSDIHAGVQYCKSTNSINIDELLNIKSNTYQVLLEESLNNSGLNLTELWDAEHTNKLRELKENNRNVIPIDIRPYLIPFSWQLAESNKKYQECKIEIYLSLFYNFFNKTCEIYKKFISPYFEYIDSNEINNLIKVFNFIKKRYNDISSKYTGKTIGYIFEKDKLYLHGVDDINSYVMEYYILVLTLSDKRDSIIHTGLAHSSRLKNMLSEYFNFKVIQEHKMTNIKEYNNGNNINACIMNPKIESNFF